MKLPFRLRRSYRRIGDRYRAAGDWHAAELAYRRHLKRKPGDAEIHVQLGHALKEQDRLADAADAYAGATRFPAVETDALHHLADMLKRLGRDADALDAYQRLHDMTDDPDAWQNITRLRRRKDVAPAVVVDGDTVFFLIQDLFVYLSAHVTMSGIQRVQAGIAARAIDDPAITARFILNHIDGEPGLDAGEFWMIDNAALGEVVAYASGTSVAHATLRRMLRRCQEAAVRVRPVAGNTIMALGAIWVMPGSVEQLVQPKRDGVRIGAYIYDLIPITNPEYCDAYLVGEFGATFVEIAFLADFMLTISEATRDAVVEYLAAHGGRPIPVTAVPLAHLMSPAATDAPVWPKALAGLKDKPFAAYVSTVEGRKNHLYVVNAWRQMIAGGVKVPDLVFVGRMGWRIAGLKELLDATDYLGGRVHIVHDLSDGELNAIYAHCQFTVFTSFVEGWGLPVGEALVHHRPCVASNTSSIPEVGGDFVDYVDPHNLRDGIAVLTRMITDDAYRAAREANIRDHFVPRTWDDVARHFLDEIAAAQRRPLAPARDLCIPSGKVLWFEGLAAKPDALDRYFALPYRLLVGSGDFYRVEPGGTWMRGRSGVFELHTTLNEGDAAAVFLKLWTAPWSAGTRVRIAAEGGEASAALIVDTNALSVGDGVRMTATVGANGLVTLRFDVEGDYTVPATDARDFVIGLRALGYARIDDLIGRQNLVEGFSFRHGG